MANTYVNKVQLADGTSLIDISDTTATADKILSGYTAYGADGSKLTGTATGGGGSVTQDQDGFIVLPPTGGGGGGSTGLVYESGTYTPVSDITQPTISFTDTHTTAPFYAIIQDVDTEDTTPASSSVAHWEIINWYEITGALIHSATADYYGRRNWQHFTSSSTSTSGGWITSLTGTDMTSFSNYFTTTAFKPMESASHYFRAGRHYKWIAVWAPTT